MGWEAVGGGQASVASFCVLTFVNIFVNNCRSTGVALTEFKQHELEL